MDKQVIIFSILMIIVGLLVATSASMTQETREQEVDCFDRYGSLIHDIKCTETQYSYYGIDYGYGILLVPVFMFMFVCIFGGLMILAIEIVDPKGDANCVTSEGVSK